MGCARLRLEMKTTNAAFGDSFDDKAAEAARILRALADHLESMTQGYPMGNLRDANGNGVGSWSWEHG